MTVTRSVRAEASRNERGSAESRRRRKRYLLDAYAANVEALVLVDTGDDVLAVLQERDSATALLEEWSGQAVEWQVRPACRCYRCGDLLVFETLTVDRIVPGCQKGTYRRTNIRPACFDCNRETGNGVRSKK